MLEEGILFKICKIVSLLSELKDFLPASNIYSVNFDILLLMTPMFTP